MRIGPVVDRAKIKALRVKRGETAERFATRVGITRGTLEGIEKGPGSKRPTRLVLQAIAGGLGVSPEELLLDGGGDESAGAPA